jgi:2,4-diketo-3-deoxy-L-fuconate hydrolase
LNYSSHANEVDYDYKSVAPPVFTKFPTSITGPYANVEHPGGSVDWEVELVVVLGREAYRVPAERSWEYVAGVTIGQDISERDLQHEGDMPQFSLGKSYRGFGPTGPWLVTVDEFADPDDLELACAVNGEEVQRSTTAQLIMSVPRLIERLSDMTSLLPGDIIFTGTPAGVGLAQTPPRFLSPGDEIVSTIAGVGEMRNRIVARTA